MNVDLQPMRAGRRGAMAGFLGVDASRALYCGLQKNECQCGTCDGRCGPEDGCPCVACQVALLRRDSSIGTNVEGRPVFRGTDPNSIYCGYKTGPCKCGTCDGRCGPSNGCPCDACVAFVLGQRASGRNDMGAPAWKGHGGTGGFLDIPATGLFYCGRLTNECRCGRCDGRCGPSDGCPCSSCLVLYRLSSAPALKNSDGVPVWPGGNGQAGVTGLAASSVYYCGRRGMKQCGCGKCPDQRCGPTDGCPCNACLTMVSMGNAGAIKAVLQTRESSIGFHALTHKLLHAAVAQDRCDIVDAVLSVSKLNLNSMSSDGVTLLCAAVQSGHVKIAQRLLAAGAMPNLACRSGETPLYLSVSLGQYDAVDLLLQYTTDPNLACATGYLPSNEFARTLSPLHVAAIENHERIARRLILAGANPTVKCSQHKMPYQWAKPSSQLGVLLTQYTDRYVFDAAVDKILSQGLATMQELEHLGSLITTVYDLRVVFSIGNALCESRVLSQEEFVTILSKAFEHMIDGKLIESARSAGFFRMLLDHCVRSRLISKEHYTNFKSEAKGSLRSQQDIEQITRVRNEVHELRWQRSTSKERIPKLQVQIKHVAKAYQQLHQRTLGYCGVLELSMVKQQCVFEFMVVACMFANAPVFRDCFDQVIDLASPVELLGAAVDHSSVDTFMNCDWSKVALTSEAVAVLEKADAQLSEFIDMLRAAIRSTGPAWLVDPEQHPVKLSGVLLALTNARTAEVSEKELDEIFAAIQEAVDPQIPAPSGSMDQSAELVFLGDIDRLLYHSAIQCSNGHLGEFTDMVSEIELEKDEQTECDINEFADVRYADDTSDQLSPLEYACHLGYVDIVKYLLDREDVVKSMSRGSYFISAKRRQKLLTEATGATEQEPPAATGSSIDFTKPAWG